MNLVKTMWTKTLAEYFAAASFGAVSIPSDAPQTNVLSSYVTIGCSGISSDGSTWSSRGPLDARNLRGWAEAADSVVAQRGIDLNEYQYRVYLMPTSVGLVSFGDTKEAFRPNNILRVWAAVLDTNVNAANMAHELGHNLGLYHAQGYDDSGALVEYADASCPMGSASQLAHYNAPSSVALGWTTPQAVLRAADLPVGVWSTFKLRGLADSAVSSLQIFPGSWNSTWGDSDQLLVSFRRYTPTNADSGLQPQFRNKVQVHSLSPNYFGFGPSVLLAGALDDDTRAVWPRPGSAAPPDAASPQLVVRVLLVDEANGAAYVSLCRRAGGNGNSCAF
ncbi:hypothetical protein GPECTOR_60g721 [Gonium pectorale]|uniref:Peptidase M11 gametolysin domain-containing protein n=1 Tax=Gonium pectorale TaxID=33097 RepID=A0A150G542_GONPE|nr:hypothetical protein GPECTOR_60g721 [Gonium pectorale]|eukprot:KXZ44944.1 hypothetical protein GPECTOR_60g721 [Gonium pectorale]